MECQHCGSAIPTVSSPSCCPSCRRPIGPVTFDAAASGVAASAVWPPVPVMSHPGQQARWPDDRPGIQKQRQAGILMAIIPLVAVQAASAPANALPAPYGSILLIVIVLAGIYPHFRGCAHWAESKGYPRYEGRILGILSWLGILLLAIRRDKALPPA